MIKIAYLLILNCLISQKFQFKQLGIESGLSQSNVYSILQDQNKYMWFATEDGLNNYDGYNFTVFKNNISDTSSLQTNDINEIALDYNGNIWIGTWGGGLSKFDPLTSIFTNFTHNRMDSSSLSGNRVQSLFFDSDSTLWIGTNANGLNHLISLDQNRFVRYTTENSNISNNRIWSIASNKSGEIWLATENGLNLLHTESGQVTTYFNNSTDPHSISHNLIRALYFDKSATLWIGTELGLNKMTGENKFERFTNRLSDQKSISHNVINKIFEDSFGQIWIGTVGGGLNKLNPLTTEFTNYQNDPNNPISISSNDVRDIFEDHSLNLWISTRGGGVNKINLKQKPFRHFTKNKNGLSHNRILSIQQSDNNTIWIGTREGITIYDINRNSFTHLKNEKQPQSLSDNFVRVLAYDELKKSLWIGTENKGISQYNPITKQFRHFEHQINNVNSPLDNEIQALYDDGDFLWIGTELGLSRLTKSAGTFKHFFTENLEKVSVITLGGNKDYLFIGSDDNGLYILNKDNFEIEQFVHNSKNDKSITNNVILSMLVENDIAWIGTEKGLNKFDLKSKHFTLFGKQHGLVNLAILAILSDDKNLWFSTNLGLSKFNKSDYTTRNYSQIDGLLNSGYIRGSSFKSNSGELYFGAYNGLTLFNPSQIKQEQYQFPVKIRRITSFLNNSTKTVLDNMITLGADDNSFNIEFLAMDYTQPEKNTYQYKLEGFDSDWITAGTRTIATYTNVEPNNYVFKVKGSNSFNQWSTEITQLEIIIEPHFYQTTLFKVLMILFFLKFLYLIYWLRVKLIKSKNKELQNEIRVRLKTEDNMENLIHELETKNAEMERFTYTVSHDLKSPLITIKGFLGALESDLKSKKLKDPKYYFNHINSGVDKMDELLSELLNLSRIGHQIGAMEEINLNNLVQEVLEILHGQIQQSDAIIKINGDLPIVYADYKRLIEVYQNLIDNGIKFRKKEINPIIEIGTLKTNSHPVFYVKDNGIGVSEQYQEKIFDLFERLSNDNEGSGVGLALVRRIIELHQGKIWLESNQGQGSIFKFTLGDMKWGKNDKDK